MSSNVLNNKFEENLNENQIKVKTKQCFEPKVKNNSKYDSNSNKTNKTIDNNIKRDSNKQIDDSFNTTRHKSYYKNNYRKNYSNDYYYYNSNRFNKYSDGNRRQEYYSKPTNQYSNYDKRPEKREINDKTNSFKELSNDNKSDKSESNCSYESNDVNCSPNADKSTKTDNNLQIILDEITALKSIFDENVLTIDEKQLKGRFLAEPVLNTNQFVVFYKTDRKNSEYSHSYRYNSRYDSKYNNRSVGRKDSSSGQSSQSDGTEEFCVQHLPPIELYFELPEEYPSKLNPKFLISCKWLNISELELICEKLENMWKESKMEILFTWFSYLQNEVMNLLGIEDKLDITFIISVKPKWITKTEITSKSSQTNSLTTLSKASLSRYGSRRIIEFKPSLKRGLGSLDRRAACDLIGEELITHLKAYNEYKRKETFNKSYITCNICFSPHLGEDCVVFACNHINCKTCIRDYFTTLVKDGNVNLLKCPESECQTSAPPNLVRELISEDLYKKYDDLLLESVIGSMSDVYYCPRKACGSLVIAESDSSLAHCSICGYAFCKNCKFSYHGFDPCQMFRNKEQRKVILDKYRDASVNEKLELEKVYGKKQLTAALEEAATEKWLEDMAKRCPHCKASIEKSDGCNKMSCWRCNTYFCWICLQQLPVTQPYSHYNNPESKCFNQLFRGVNFEEMDDLFEDFVE